MFAYQSQRTLVYFMHISSRSAPTTHNMKPAMYASYVLRFNDVLFRMHGVCPAYDALPWRTCCGVDGAFIAFPNTPYVRKPIRKM